MSRCVRSTLAAESIASDNAMGNGLRHRTLFTELIFGEFIDGGPRPEDPFAIFNPFWLPNESSSIKSMVSGEMQSSSENHSWFAGRKRFSYENAYFTTNNVNDSEIPGCDIYMCLRSSPDQIRRTTH